MQCTTDFASSGVHLPVGLPYVRSKLQWLRRNDGSVTQQSTVWILVVASLKDLWEGLDDPWRVGVDKSPQSCNLVSV